MWFSIRQEAKIEEPREEHPLKYLGACMGYTQYAGKENQLGGYQCPQPKKEKR